MPCKIQIPLRNQILAVGSSWIILDHSPAASRATLCTALIVGPFSSLSDLADDEKTSFGVGIGEPFLELRTHSFRDLSPIRFLDVPYSIWYFNSLRFKYDCIHTFISRLKAVGASVPSHTLQFQKHGPSIRISRSRTRNAEPTEYIHPLSLRTSTSFSRNCSGT
ncbi:hypothetical protein ARMSODRAFT_418634 [Armillaria solidipes]|uniref:Uncharacterized protein n=1 Tax=Armillaria solidipes TaxID=1076256 RepID=A0A2H3C279_9AGAR|nr:hypothetical protein ARMSODRAFT_418634 [Armillaria solidipes]